MTENTEVSQDVTEAPAKSDAEEALRAQATPETGAEEVKADDEPKAEKPNRTKAYIQRLQQEVADLRRIANERLATPDTSAQSTRTAPAPSDGEPTLADHDYDLESYNRAHARWVVREELKTERQNAEAATAQKAQQDALTSYQERVWAFEESHPDYLEAVDGFFNEYQPGPEVQMAVIRHERGPEIAYYIANNDDEAFAIANTLPRNAEAAIARLVKRMDATQQAPIPTAQPVRAISQAPAPTPRVGGRSVVQPPPEKMTDDAWYKAEKERLRKR
jgi:hypothetical protein